MILKSKNSFAMELDQNWVIALLQKPEKNSKLKTEENVKKILGLKFLAAETRKQNRAGPKLGNYSAPETRKNSKLKTEVNVKKIISSRNRVGPIIG